MRLALAIVFAVIIPQAAAQSQISGMNALSLESGARARLLGPATGSRFIVIRVGSTTADSLRYTLERSVEARSMGWRQISRMDASLGSHRHTWRGAGIGLLVGAVGGALAGSRERGEMRGFVTAATGVIAGGVGAVVGGVLGYSWQTEKWISVKLPDNPQVPNSP